MLSQQKIIQDLKVTIAFQQQTISMHNQKELNLRNYIQELHKRLLILEQNNNPETIEKARPYISMLAKKLS